MKPSEYQFPFNSVFRKTKAELVALNIMIILGRTGNKFRELTWKEYKNERLKDKDNDFSQMEKPYFNKVMPYCKSKDTASLFSLAWKS